MIDWITGARQRWSIGYYVCYNEGHCAIPQAAMVTGFPVTDITTATASIRALQDTGTSCVVLTLGEKGLLYTQLVMGQWTPTLHIAAEKVNVVDTTVRSMRCSTHSAHVQCM